ncbi:hypothetical protein [Acinetobacter tandoii]|uniref:Uncharacterized protein n=1 Tax=Acinetobacter tandoii DSM 14970 = CIP 107469 TaxID=1120927 RepID=R9B1A5_9GAMM|nr:hypothetical protein [Acinetobacter tandoii]EOR08197.1 hypothetical protein I593_01552 [Acinetobacter tandoii DSM 14970 = CIP 107469]
MMINNFQCHNCGLKVEIRSCPVCETNVHILDLNNPMDAFIASGGFVKALAQTCDSSPERVVKSSKEMS